MKEKCIERLTLFSDWLYGSSEDIWSGFDSRESIGGQQTYQDRKLLEELKIYFEFVNLELPKFPYTFFVPNKLFPITATKNISYINNGNLGGIKSILN